MAKLLVLYYSRTGNTEKMANAVSEGAQLNGGIEVELNFHVTAEELGNFDAVVIGTPTYYHEMPIDFKKLFDDVVTKNIILKGKIGATFGSYGWSGEAPKLVREIFKKFGMQVIEPPLLAMYTPDQSILAACKDLGRKVADTLR